MSVQNAVPTISFAGLEIEPKATVKFVTNFNEQQRRLIVFIEQLNTLAIAMDTEVSQSQQAITSAEQSAIAAIGVSREDAKQAVLQIASALQNLVDDANQSKLAAQSAANNAATNVATQLQLLVNTVNGYASDAEGSKDSAQAWAVSENALAGGNKSAKSYVADAQQLVNEAANHAQTAQSAAAGNIIDDNNSSSLTTLSSQQIETLLGGKANAENAVLSGAPTTPTAGISTNSNQIASTAFVQALLSAYSPPVVAPTAAQVGSAISQQGFGTVGTYVFGKGGVGNPGAIISGSTIRSSNTSLQVYTSLSGTWMSMGLGRGSDATLYKRIG